ncbi:O-acyltransferase like protein-like [Aricia agestis]|uniref:O-acyltransferase like protein-like n=1 Tax=Aricia agestis TaxID=91739 RepID=UPI001C20C1CB|nr:O-acyltransferase like protein-like [Aricia agestis]
MFAPILLCLALAAAEPNATNREEKFRSALIDAFQNIKHASAKGGFDEGISDLTGSRAERPERQDSFDLFSDADGLSFAEHKDDSDPETTPTTPRAHNVQHIVKTTKSDRTTAKPRDLVRAPEVVSNVTEVGLEMMLRVLDGSLLAAQWPQLRGSVGGPCRGEMNAYVHGLQEKALWALKMEDASGRYTSMFYWGNNYWTGSAELCAVLNTQTETTKKKNKSVSQIFSDWRQDVTMSGLNPPFAVAFYNVKMAVTADLPELIRTHRTIHLGLCLPRSCSKEQVTQLVNAAHAPMLHQTVVAIRSPQHGGYTFYMDPTFFTLMAISLIVGSLLIAGTVYDLRLAREVRMRRQRFANMAAENSSGDVKLNGLDGITVTKGKSMYNVNNNISIHSKSSEERLTAETVSTDEEVKLSKWQELLLSFSVKANILQIFDKSVGSDTVPEVHGLRTFSMIWIIFGHTCIIAFRYADNTALRAILEKSFWFQLIVSAVYSVDTFFCLGGMLVSYLYFRTNAKGNLDRLTKGRSKVTAGFFQFLGLMGYRFARLTAPYLFILGVVEVVMKWFHANAVFEVPANDHETCPAYWWRNLLYINTLFPVEQMCMLWSWYLSDDTQFYAVSAIILILSTSHLKVSAVLSVVLFFSSLITTGYVSWSSDHVPNGEDPFTQFDKIYDKPWTRFGPYLVGMATGWILFKTNSKIRFGRLWAYFGWAVCSAVLLFLVFGLYILELSGGGAALYSALSHSLWAACIGWVIVACSTGHGGPVRSLLAWPVLYPLSRVTYCTYLVHPVLLRVVAMHLTHPIHLGEVLVFVLFLGLTVMSYFFAFILSVAFEAPVVTMLKILSPQKKPHRV